MTDAEVLAMFADSINDGLAIFDPRQNSKEIEVLFDSAIETETETEEVTHA